MYVRDRSGSIGPVRHCRIMRRLAFQRTVIFTDEFRIACAVQRLRHIQVHRLCHRFCQRNADFSFTCGDDVGARAAERGCVTQMRAARKNAQLRIEKACLRMISAAFSISALRIRLPEVAIQPLQEFPAAAHRHTQRQTCRPQHANRVKFSSITVITVPRSVRSWCTVLPTGP